MKKRDRRFQAIEKWKNTFRKLGTQSIRRRLAELNEVLYAEAGIALKDLLAERKESG